VISYLYSHPWRWKDDHSKNFLRLLKTFLIGRWACIHPPVQFKQKESAIVTGGGYAEQDCRKKNTRYSRRE